MSDLRDLYQEVIFEHNRHPRNFGRPAGVNREAEGHNPLCGDRIKVYLRVDDDVIAEAAFEGAISQSSASLMTEALKGLRVEEAEQLVQRFHSMLTAGDPAAMGKLQVFAGVREFPSRIKCATLAWHTLNAALRHLPEAVTTEDD